MGKASRWIRSFLIGKKEGKEKQNNNSFSAENVTTPTVILPPNPKEWRRWSFGRSPSTESAHKRAISFDSIATTPSVVNEQNHAMVLAMAITTNAASGKPRAVEDAAATKIQAVFRSHLARKALCALRGLVKLQALVRGHLVRKETTATLRCMHALMAIQVRARVQRIQMVDEEQHVIKKQSIHRKFSRENSITFRKAHSERMDANLDESRGGLKRRNGYLNHRKIERMEQGFVTNYSGNLSIPKQESQLPISPAPSTLTDMSSSTCNRQVQKYSFTTAHNSPQYYSAMSKPDSTKTRFPFPQPEFVDSISHDYPLLPNYMAKTKSSRAKVRSQSEPKQRPKWLMRQRSRRTPSMEGMSVQQDVQMQHSSSQARPVAHENQGPWLIRLYRSTKSLKHSEYDSTRVTTSNSNCCRSLVAYDPPVNLY